MSTLEGGTGKNIEERKELFRNIVKVVHNYIFYLEPVEDRGPYDIVSTALCLEYVCMTNEENRESVTEEACLVKPHRKQFIHAS